MRGNPTFTRFIGYPIQADALIIAIFLVLHPRTRSPLRRPGL